MITKASLQKRLDKAIQVLNSFGIMPSETETTRMAELLDDVLDVDPPKITAIGRVMQYMSSFNELVRDEIKDIKILCAALIRHDGARNRSSPVIFDGGERKRIGA